MKSFTLLSAVSALLVAGTVAYAQPTPSAPSGNANQEPRGRMTRADFDSLMDARVAAIQAGLKLTPEQQTLWAPVEQAIRAMAATRAENRERFRERRSQAGRPDLMQRLEQRSELATKSAANLTALSTAMKPFWAALDDRQKRLLPVLMNEGRGGKGRGGRHHGRHHGGMGMHHGGGKGMMQQGGQQQAPEGGAAPAAPRP